ncbi:glutathione S-transferase [Aestuariispira ectoiniformans]|uniref:glutathione S-transferase n=1 Tax=Aestuariispira ectoiniformans TaxID=2775080 RepID=UPI00223BF803|nr:glutathione S-transferase [Aestuariispira ectoiniformans]
MADYTLCYWPLPFRGQFIRTVLAHLEVSWEETGSDVIATQRALAPQDQLVPHMGPPILIDHAAGVSLSQTPAILTYLGSKHGMLPGDPLGDALTAKVMADANDVLCDMTLNNGAQMWTRASWDNFQPRLERWMEIFETTGRRHGMTAQVGFLLGTDAPGIADFAAYTLWNTMTSSFPTLRSMLDAKAPAIAGLCDRLAVSPDQERLRAWSDAEYGDTWCGGMIEASLRAAL